MKNFLKVLSVLMLLFMSANQVSAQIKDGEATVVQGSTTTVSIGAAYANTLASSTSVYATWTTSSSAISIQSRTNTYCTIKGNAVGKAKLYYKCSYIIDGFYRTMNFYYDITIKPNTILVTRIEMQPSSSTMEIGETLQLKATAYPTNATNRSLNWTTDNYRIATVSSSGLVTAKSVGKVKIWANAKDGSGARNYCVIEVKEPTKVVSIELSATEKTLAVDEKFVLSATVFPQDAYNKKLRWMSDNENIATVNNGVVTAICPGDCDIICESSDGSNVSAICHITVQEPEQYWLSVVVPNGNFAINVTDLNLVNVKITPDDGYTINSVTLDGEEQSHNDGEILLEKFTHNSTLNIVFVSDECTGVESVGENSVPLKVLVSNHRVAVEGLSANQVIYVYDTNGTLIKLTTEETFELPRMGIYILRIGNKSFKVAIY